MAYLDIRKNSRGTSYRVKYRPTPGSPEKVETFGDQAEAERWRDLCNLMGPAAALKALEPPAPDLPPPYTIADVMHDHIEAISGIDPRTRRDYARDAEAHIIPVLGHIEAAHLTPRQVSLWINGLDLAPKTVKNQHGLLSAALNSAREEGRIERNVARGRTLPEIDDTEMVFLEPDEFETVCQAMPEYYRPFVRFLVGTGLRWSEATALQTRHLDLDNGSLHVRQAWKDVSGRQRLGTPKTRRGRRKVEFGEKVARELAAATRGRPGDAFVWINQRGGPILNGSFHALPWQPAMRKLAEDGFPKKPRIHDLRHTFASWHLNEGTTIFVLSRMMGHKSASVTTDRYGHLQDEKLSHAAQVIDNILS